MGFRKKKTTELTAPAVGLPYRSLSHPFDMLDSYVPLGGAQSRLYSALREAVPIIDAAILKLVRLTGNFEVFCKDKKASIALKNFLDSVPVGGNGMGIQAFISAYFEQLLTYGTAVGEMVTNGSQIVGLCNTPLSCVELKRSKDGFGIEVCSAESPFTSVKYPDLILLSALNPEPGELAGTSLLKGLPFVSSVLLKIINTIGINWERVGNVRFAVTYKPQNDASDRVYAKERAMQVAQQWGEAMQPGAGVKDFVTVGDVSIKAIGADNQILDSEVPIKQMLEQIVAKTGLPPFMLGLSWASTERMSSQQADVLTSELEAYRRILTPVIAKICRTFLRLNAMSDDILIEWDDITLQDQVELSRAMLYEAQAKQIIKNM